MRFRIDIYLSLVLLIALIGTIAHLSHWPLQKDEVLAALPFAAAGLSSVLLSKKKLLVINLVFYIILARSLFVAALTNNRVAVAFAAGSGVAVWGLAKLKGAEVDRDLRADKEYGIEQYGTPQMLQDVLILVSVLLVITFARGKFR